MNPKIEELIRKAQAQANASLILKKQEEERIRKQDLIDEDRFASENGPAAISYDLTKPTCEAKDLVIQDLNAPVEVISNRIFNWNTEQQRAIDLAVSTDKDFCLIGPAGTGKTTTEVGLIRALLDCGKVVPMKWSTKRLKAGSPSIAVVSYTRRAVQAAKKALSADLRNNCMTIHKLLEYEPVFYEVLDPQTGMMKKTMRFEPQRTKNNPIPDLTQVFIDESSMCAVDLFKQLKDACPNARFIFVGDIQQLPPIYGSAILGFKMLETEVVELKQVYRQALESPIIRLAHRILSGNPIAPSELPELENPPELKFHMFKKRVAAESCIVHVKKFFVQLCKEGKFNPETDVVLCPFNEAFGTLELNRAIAQQLGENREAPVFEIISGFQKHYLAVGDRVLVDKQDGIIKEIVPNGLYVGRRPHKPSKKMNRYGNYISAPDAEELEDEKMDEDSIERMLELTESRDDEEKKNQASHIIKIAPVMEDENEVGNFTWDLSTAGEVNQLLFSYALTVHKSQGSEFERVYFVMHHSHATMCQREMLYTAVTRAKKYLYIICENRSAPGKEDSTFEVGIRSQRIKGNTLAEKAEFFKGKVLSETAKEKIK